MPSLVDRVVHALDAADSRQEGWVLAREILKSEPESHERTLALRIMAVRLGLEVRTLEPDE